MNDLPAMPPSVKRAGLRWTALRVLILISAVLLAWAGHTTAALTLFIAAAIFMAYLALSPSTRLLGPIVTRIYDADGVLLTFDDGPCPEKTLPLLDLLDQHGVKALFFLIGERVQQWPELAREILRRGHAVGNHTQTHPATSFWRFASKRTWEEIAGCQLSLRAVMNHEARWFRAPAGHYQAFTHSCLRALGLQLMGWSRRGFDGVDPRVVPVLHRLTDGVKVADILLLHEGKPMTLELTRRVLETLKTKGLPITDPAGLGAAPR